MENSSGSCFVQRKQHLEAESRTNEKGLGKAEKLTGKINPQDLL
jgi:hypothetical protein